MEKAKKKAKKKAKAKKMKKNNKKKKNKKTKKNLCIRFLIFSNFCKQKIPRV